MNHPHDDSKHQESSLTERLKISDRRDHKQRHVDHKNEFKSRRKGGLMRSGQLISSRGMKRTKQNKVKINLPSSKFDSKSFSRSRRLRRNLSKKSSEANVYHNGTIHSSRLNSNEYSQDMHPLQIISKNTIFGQKKTKSSPLKAPLLASRALRRGSIKNQSKKQSSNFHRNRSYYKTKKSTS